MSDLRRGQVRLGPRSWGAIREAYLSGTSAAALAEAYGCSVGTIRYRAVREGWRRCDVGAHAEPPPDPQITHDDEEDAPSLEALARTACRAAMRAVKAGRPADAAAYIRVVEAVERLGAGGEAASQEESEAASDLRDREYEAEIQRRLSVMPPEQRARTLAMIQEKYPEFIYTGPLP
jgi:hypothetical protein